jgi:hypothetical protein
MFDITQKNFNEHFAPAFLSRGIWGTLKIQEDENQRWAWRV